MGKDFSTQLKNFLENYSNKKRLNLTFECEKYFDLYHIKVTDAQGDSEEKEIDQAIVSDFIELHSLTSKKIILKIIFNPGPRITNTPGH